MSYGSRTFWELYIYGWHPLAGTLVLSVAVTIFIVGIRDARERRLFWVATILGVVMLGFLIGEWWMNSDWLEFWKENAFGASPGSLLDRKVLSNGSRMMFMAQAGLAIAFALGLLWWPIRARGES